MLRKTKNFLKANGVYYEKEHVNRLHGQQHPREFRNEAQLLQYLKKHSKRYVKGKEISNKKRSK